MFIILTMARFFHGIQHILLLVIRAPHSTLVLFKSKAAPLPEVNEELTSIIIPNIYPIIVPEGTTQLPEVDKGSRALQLNPNPAQGQVSVIAQEGVRLIEVADMSGRVLLQKPFDGMEESVVLDISRLPVGTYIVKVATNHTTATGKLVVE